MQKIKNKKLKSLHVLLWKFTVSKYEYDGNLFAATRKKIIAIFDGNANVNSQSFVYRLWFLWVAVDFDVL